MTDRRKRRWLFAASLLLLLALTALALRRQPKIYSNEARVLDAEAISGLLDTRQEAGDEDDEKSGELYRKEEKLPYCAYERTFYVPVLSGKMPRAADFQVESTGREQQVVFADFPADEEALVRAVKAGEGFSLYIYDDEVFRKYQVVFTGTPVLDITFSDETDGEYTIVHIDMHSGPKDNGKVVSSEAKMRVRGGVSRNYPKLGFKLKLFEEDAQGNRQKRNVRLLGLRRDSKWNLAALYADDTKIRDKVAIDLWADMSADTIPFSDTFGTRMEYVEVIMNGEYMGLYGLMEPIDEKQLGITDGGSQGLHEYYYKKEGEDIGQDSDFVFSSVDERVPEKEEGLPDMILAGLELKNGNGHAAQNAWAPIREYMRMVREETFAEDAGTLLDLENVADVWIYIQAIMGVDNRAKNLYYCAKVVDGAYKIYFVPWDMDMTWGNETDETSPTLQSYYTYPVDKILSWSPGTQLIERNVGNIRQIIKERWEELYDGGVLSPEVLTGQMKQQSSYLLDSGAFARDAERWEDSPHTDDFTKITEYAKERLQVLDEYIRGL